MLWRVLSHGVCAATAMVVNNNDHINLHGKMRCISSVFRKLDQFPELWHIKHRSSDIPVQPLQLQLHPQRSTKGIKHIEQQFETIAFQSRSGKQKYRWFWAGFEVNAEHSTDWIPITWCFGGCSAMESVLQRNNNDHINLHGKMRCISSVFRKLDQFPELGHIKYRSSNIPVQPLQLQLHPQRSTKGIKNIEQRFTPITFQSGSGKQKYCRFPQQKAPIFRFPHLWDPQSSHSMGETYQAIIDTKYSNITKGATAWVTAEPLKRVRRISFLRPSSLDGQIMPLWSFLEVILLYFGTVQSNAFFQRRWLETSQSSMSRPDLRQKILIAYRWLDVSNYLL
jgi:hypothetical protein